MSVSAALCYRWDWKEARLFFRMKADSYETESLIQFLDDLHRELDGDKVVLIWDGLPAHRSRAMKEYISRQRSWLVVEPLPGYAPDLNPVEALWGNVKGQELANRCVDFLAEAREALKAGFRRVRRRIGLAYSFLRQTGLSF
jgi:putative transposase